jgi:hypothetical protein
LASQSGIEVTPIKESDIRLTESLYLKQCPAVNRNFVHAETFSTMLGFQEFDTIDLMASEGATIIHDLNVILRNHKQYDVVLDLGTSEHIFNLPVLFENIANLLKIQGYVIHIVPITTLNHGFVLFSPTLFYDVYSENGFDIVDAYMIRNYYLMDTVTISPYSHLRDNHTNALLGYLRPFGGCFISQSFCCVAQKRKSGPFRIPLQGSYQKLYDETKRGEHGEPPSGKHPQRDDWRIGVQRWVTRKSPLFVREVVHLMRTLIYTYRNM